MKKVTKQTLSRRIVKSLQCNTPVDDTTARANGKVSTQIDICNNGTIVVRELVGYNGHGCPIYKKRRFKLIIAELT